jgi:cellulose synthase/poly-beta-1,6-N-acetylglucosamine synthase-like glycosyltransferase
MPAVRPLACPEVDCIRHLLPRHIVAAAEARARSIGVGADRVLICADAITEEAYLTALASSLGTSYEPLDSASRADCPLDDNQMIQAAAAGLLPLQEGGKIVWVVAPRCVTARNLADTHWPVPPWLESFRLTSSERLWRFVARYTQITLGGRAADSLRRSQPLMSNAPRGQVWKSVSGAAAVIVAVTVLALVPAPTINTFASLLCTIFLIAASLRLGSAALSRYLPTDPARIDDRELPIYTIICALYREADVVDKLVAAIRALDYPIEKLDVKFVLEADDAGTRNALSRLDLGPPFEIIIAPAIGPRTKPKALNVALPLARGLYTAIYDAEDVPERDQLRRAVSAFQESDDRLACLQASLTIDNTADNWLSRMFTANYAGQFDVLLPGLAALNLPFPLGGSSNHFRTAALRAVGGWDPYNVTEDADLGMRLYRLGYRTAALSSTTYEEAPARFVPWLRQRTRWYKGWIQTWRVHMRRPLRLVRELRLHGAIVFQLFLACNVLAALIHPFFMAFLCYSLVMQPPLRALGAMGEAAGVFVATLFAGYISTMALELIGLRRRRLLAHAWVLVLMPFYWFLLSLAAWRAVLQLVYDPQGWEKTQHGLAKHSRVAEARRRQVSGGNQAIRVAPTTLMANAALPIVASGRDISRLSGSI